MFDIDWHLALGQLAYDPHAPLIFSSGLFLFLFLGFSLMYWLLGKADTLRIVFVTAFSYYFYYKSSGLYFALLALVTVSDFLIARAIGRSREANGTPRGEHTAGQRWLLVLSLAVDLGLLGYFKYTNFLGSLLAPLWGGTFRPLDIFLPIGISFFTFQSLSYTIDVYRGELKPLTRLLDYAFYVSFFPPLVAGPIVRARDFIPQIKKRLTLTDAMFGEGVFLIVAGLFKKAVISDYISVNFVERIFEQPSLYSGVENLLAVYGYALQIYCDFSGYSDMAIGLALLLGFKVPQNFNSPYKSQSVTEFWRRWHISLSSWLRDYIYISCGGNRHGKFRQSVNLMITMLLGGLWHGASLNFIVWGGLHGLFLIGNKLADAVLRRPKRYTAHGLHRVLRIAVTFHVVCLCWVLFRCPDFPTAVAMVARIATHFQPQVFVQWVEAYWAVAALMALGYVLHFLPGEWSARARAAVTAMPLVVKALLVVAVIFIVIQIKSSEVQPFIYFQF